MGNKRGGRKPKHPSIGDFRTRFVGCIELVKRKPKNLDFNAKPNEMAIMNQVAAKIKDWDDILAGTTFFAPPLCHQRTN